MIYNGIFCRNGFGPLLCLLHDIKQVIKWRRIKPGNKEYCCCCWERLMVSCAGFHLFIFHFTLRILCIYFYFYIPFLNRKWKRNNTITKQINWQTKDTETIHKKIVCASLSLSVYTYIGWCNKIIKKYEIRKPNERIPNRHLMIRIRDVQPLFTRNSLNWSFNDGQKMELLHFILFRLRHQLKWSFSSLHCILSMFQINDSGFFSAEFG